MLRATTFLFTLALVLPSSAQEPPKTDFGFDPKTIPAPDPAYGPPVVRVFGEYIYLARAVRLLERLTRISWMGSPAWSGATCNYG